MLKKIVTTVAAILTSVFLLFCGASADPAVTADNSYNTATDGEKVTLEQISAETFPPSESTETQITDTDTSVPTEETVTEEVTETSDTSTDTESETAPITEEAEPDETPVTDISVSQTEDVSTDEPVPEDNTSIDLLTFDPPIKELPPLSAATDVDPSKPMVALTFDDGPSPHTDRLLDIFNTHGGKGTFFLVGANIDYRPETVKRIISEGHELGGHSVDHSQLTKLCSADIAYQFSWTRDKILELTGIEPYIVRPPYGAYNDEVKRVAAGLGIALINWSVDTLDWKYRNSETVHDKIMSSAYDGAIILCHDIHKTTVDAMETVVPELIENGYQLVTVSELLSMKYGSLTAGTVYNNR